MSDEGYMKLKIRELKEDLNEVQKSIDMYVQLIKNIETTTGQYKEFIKKLKSVESYKEELSEQINNEYKTLTEKVLDDVNNRVDALVENKLNESYDEFMTSMEQRCNTLVEKQNKKTDKLVENLVEQLSRATAQNETLTDMLIKRQVLTFDEIERLEDEIEKKTPQIKEEILANIKPDGE